MREWLVAIRKAKGMTTYAAAKAAGISQSYYSSIENCTRGNPLGVPIAKAIGAALGFDWTRFYENDAADLAE